LTLAGGRIEVVRHTSGSPRRPTLVFLHEGLGSAAQWRDFPARLAQRTRCNALVYSRFGYGGSDSIALPRPLHYMHDEAVGVLPELLDAAGIDSHILVGQSDGASIALIHAARCARPGLLGVISEAAHVFCEDKTVAAIAGARREFVAGTLRTGLVRHHGQNTDAAFFGWCDAWLDPAFRAWDIRPELTAIRIPVLAIQGTNDAYGTQLQLDAIRQQAGAGASIVVFAECGHAPHRDRADATLACMAAFISRLAG
jgi:pimeloyl-ACP methyl ester carboxylesterase